MTHRIVILVVAASFLVTCAQVPKESVELSTTIGRDIAEVYEAHKDLATILFARMRQDVNRFIDDVYAPFIIRGVMERDHKRAKSSDRSERRKSILLAINEAFKPGADAKLQKDTLDAMKIMVDMIITRIESKRKELLDPLAEQEAQVIGSIDRAYLQLHYANSIVTGHLSSVVKVHETQAQLLEEIGVKRDLRKEIGETVSETSDQIGKIVVEAEKIENKLDQAEEKAEEIKDAIDDLKKKLEQSSKKEE